MDFDDLLVRSVDLLESFDDVRERWQGAFNHLLVDEYQDTNHAQYRIVRLLSDAHRNVMVVGDADQAIYTWRGADIRNILDFERDFPDARVVRLEQNYRSSQRILDAANAVIEHNAGRIEKRLWSELGNGEPVRVIEADDEHDEARIVAARIGALIEGGSSASQIAVFYRTNAQSRVLEDLLVRHGVPYQVIGGPRFYERAEIKDAMAYLSVLDNPTDEIALRRIINTPRRGIGDASVDRLAATAGFAGGSLWDALADPDAAGVSTAAARSVRAFRGAHGRAARPRRRALGGRPARDAARRARASSRRSRPSARSRPRAASRTSRSSSASRASTTARSEEPSLAGLPAGGRADRRRRRAGGGGRRRPRDADDAAQRQGPRVRRGLRDRHGAEPVPARARDRGGEHRGGAPPLLRRDHARAARAVARLRPPAHALRRARQQPPVAVHRRDPGEPGRARAQGPHASARASRGSGWQPSSAGATTQLQGIAPRDELPQLSVGDNVEHDQLGEGVVTGTADGGQVIVRFRSDGSERRLLLAYAPLKRI